MGRKNKSYHKSLMEQANARLVAMQHFGESKKAAMADGTEKDKIFSAGTYHSYYKHIRYFCRWIQETHPECTTLRAARKYVNEWLEMREKSVNAKGEPLAAHTIQLEAKALGKLYGITPEDDDYYVPPKRNRVDIKRSRGPAVRDANFSEANNYELVRFCRGTGLRRMELEKLKPEDLRTRAEIEARITELEIIPKEKRADAEEKELAILRDTEYFAGTEYFLSIKGKGGRVRLSPIIGTASEAIVERIRSTPVGENVWQYVNSNADIHGYRAEYATAIYKAHARKIEDIPFDAVNKGTGRKYQSEVYTCRKDEAGKKLDKAAMLIASKALGHNRISVVADNYIREL